VSNCVNEVYFHPRLKSVTKGKEGKEIEEGGQGIGKGSRFAEAESSCQKSGKKGKGKKKKEGKDGSSPRPSKEAHEPRQAPSAVGASFPEGLLFSLTGSIDSAGSQKKKGDQKGK